MGERGYVLGLALEHVLLALVDDRWILPLLVKREFNACLAGFLPQASNIQG